MRGLFEWHHHSGGSIRVKKGEASFVGKDFRFSPTSSFSFVTLHLIDPGDDDDDQGLGHA